MDVGALLRAARHDAGLQQAVVARRVGVSRASLSRWESGARPVRADDADRVLAACGRDARFAIVLRHDDLDAELQRRGLLDLEDRLRSLPAVVLPGLLDGMQRTGAVVFGGAWAAAAYGMPALHDVGEVLLGPAPEGHAAVVRALMKYDLTVLEDGQRCGVVCDDQLFERSPEGRWNVRLIGDFDLRVTEDAGPEQRLASSAGTGWRVMTPERLVPATVDEVVLSRWNALRRREAGAT